MKGFLLLIVVVLVLALVGWVTFTWTGDRGSVNIETEKIQQDTKELVEEGRDLIDAAGAGETDSADDHQDSALPASEPTTP